MDDPEQNQDIHTSSSGGTSKGAVGGHLSFKAPVPKPAVQQPLRELHSLL